MPAASGMAGVGASLLMPIDKAIPATTGKSAKPMNRSHRRRKTFNIFTGNFSLVYIQSLQGFEILPR
ncbi:MAG: hypothetical protein F6K65_43625 [Moorea sp. SIO3C2]|nr:hypothetical protein [Moorena sp. SIO3C2]